MIEAMECPSGRVNKVGEETVWSHAEAPSMPLLGAGGHSSDLPINLTENLEILGDFSSSENSLICTNDVIYGSGKEGAITASPPHDISPPRRVSITVLMSDLKKQRKFRPFFTRELISGKKG